MQNNPNDYKYGFLYNNKDDNRLWVPKASGLGWTLNFGNKWSYVILFLILAFVAGCMVYGAYFQKA
jgi:uncharacterized membrane protein